MNDRPGRQVSLGFLAIIGLGIANILSYLKVGDVGELYIVLFFITIPGLLILNALKAKTSFWLHISLAIALSLSLLMAIGLALNSVLPLLGDHQPLRHYPALISIDIAIIALSAANLYRQRPKDKITLHLPNFRAIISAILLLFLPTLSAVGAFRLNNGGSNIASIIAILVISSVGFVVVRKLKSKTLDDMALGSILYFISLATLLLWSLRSYHLPGSDIGLEHYVFRLTSANSHWSMESFRNAYNACLSITILPTMLSVLSNMSSEKIFKIIYPAIYALTTPILYTYIRSISGKTIGFLAGFLYCTQSIFIVWMPTLARQEIALLYFACTMGLIFSADSMPKRVKKSLLIVMLFSLIISHYSSAYVVVIILLLAAVGNIVVGYYLRRSGHKDLKLSMPSILQLIVLLVFTIFWQLQITGTAGNLTAVIKNTATSLFGEQQSKNIAADKVFSFNPLSKSAENQDQLLQSYKIQQASYHSNSNQYYKDAQLYLKDSTIVYPTSLQGYRYFDVVLPKINLLVALIVRLGLAIGLIVLTIKYFKNRPQYIYYSISLICLMVLLTLFPYISTAYNIERLYQTALILLSLPVILGLLLIFRPFRNIITGTTSAVIVIICFFMYNGGITTQLAGGPASAVLNNSGSYYDENYTTTQEVETIHWLSRTGSKSIISDVASQHIIASYGLISGTATSLLPTSIEKNSYVYLSRNNVKNGTTLGLYNDMYVFYSTPNKFLYDHKNLIYSTNQTHLFR